MKALVELWSFQSGHGFFAKPALSAVEGSQNGMLVADTN